MPDWWTDSRVAATVTREYVLARLPSHIVSQVLQPMDFGQDLTDDTYLDWIVSRSRKLFLILDDLGVAELITGLVDRTFDDGDLPLLADAVAELQLGQSSLEKKFVQRQQAYLVRELFEGRHLDYLDDEVVPLELLPRLKPTAVPSMDAVTIGDNAYWRTSMPLDRKQGLDRMQVLMHAKKLEKLHHAHLVSPWTTYTHQQRGFLILGPASEMTLQSFLDDPPRSFRQLTKTQQCELLLQWIRCLSSAVAHLHDGDTHHRAIRPSNIFITADHTVVLGPHQGLSLLPEQRPAYSKDAYDCAAPEQWQRQQATPEASPISSVFPRSPISGAFPTGSRSPIASSLPSGGRAGHRNKLVRQVSAQEVPQTKSSHGARPLSNAVDQLTELASSGVPSWQSSIASSRSLASNRTSHASLASIMTASSARTNLTTNSMWSEYESPTSPAITAQRPFFACDVFSLGVVILQLLSLTASTSTSSSKFSPSALRAHLGKHHRTPGRGGAPVDSSFHANLREVHQWLDLLEAIDEESPKRINLFRRNSERGSPNVKDSDTRNFRVACAGMIPMLRHNLAREAADRYTAHNTAESVEKALNNCHLSLRSCCANAEPASTESSIKSSPSSRPTSMNGAVANLRGRPVGGTPTDPSPASSVDDATHIQDDLATTFSSSTVPTSPPVTAVAAAAATAQASRRGTPMLSPTRLSPAVRSADSSSSLSSTSAASTPGAESPTSNQSVRRPGLSRTGSYGFAASTNTTQSQTQMQRSSCPSPNTTAPCKPLPPLPTAKTGRPAVPPLNTAAALSLANGLVMGHGAITAARSPLGSAVETA